jgi:hypothetical protein
MRITNDNYTVCLCLCYIEQVASEKRLLIKYISEMYTFQPTSVLESRLSVVVVRGSVSIAISASRAFLILSSFLLHLQQHQMHNPKRKTEIIGTPITRNMNPVPPQTTPLSTLESSSLFMMTGPV